mgnify:CR=1 FL=1
MTDLLTLETTARALDRASVRAFVDEHISPYADAYDRTGAIPEELLTRIGEDGGRDIYVARPDGTHPRLIKATDGIERFPHLIVPEQDHGSVGSARR